MRTLSIEHRGRIAEAMRGKIRSKNLIGQKFEKWVVLGSAPKKKNSTEAFWECECECGRKGVVSAHRLKKGKSRGCLSCQKRKIPFGVVYNALRSAAKKQGLQLTLSYEEFVKFTEVPTCHYCDGTVVWARFSSADKNGSSYNLDRKNNSLGYVTGNLVVCCKVCNRVKSNLFSYGEMLVLGKTIREINRQKAAQ